MPIRSLLPVLVVIAAAEMVSTAHASGGPGQPPATPPAPPVVAAPGAPLAGEPPRLPPFAGAVVSFDRRGPRTVACVDRSSAPPRANAPAPTGPKPPPTYRIWLIEREVMQELMTTGGLCDPVWSPDGRTFVAAGARGLFAFAEPQYEARVLTTAGAASPPVGQTPGGPAAVAPAVTGAPIPYSLVNWSPTGRRVAFRLTVNGATSVHVIEVKDGASAWTRAMPAGRVQWGADDHTLLVDGARVAVP